MFKPVNEDKSWDVYLQLKFHSNIKGALESYAGGHEEGPSSCNDLACLTESVEVEIQNEDNERIKSMTLTLEELHKKIGEILAIAKNYAEGKMVEEVEEMA